MGFAKALLDYSKSGKSSKTVNSQKVNNILAATSKKSFISALTEIVGDSEEREQIEKQFIADICEIQKKSSEVDPEYLNAQIEKCRAKKRDVIDLTLEGVISKAELKFLIIQYDAEIKELFAKTESCKSRYETYNKQISDIREYIEKTNDTCTIDIDSTDAYAKLVREMISYETDCLDVYLNCVPFGFRLRYHREKTPHRHFQTIVVDECTTINNNSM